MGHVHHWLVESPDSERPDSGQLRAKCKGCGKKREFAASHEHATMFNRRLSDKAPAQRKLKK